MIYNLAETLWGNNFKTIPSHSSFSIDTKKPTLMECLLDEGKRSHEMMDINKGFLRFFLTFGILYVR